MSSSVGAITVSVVAYLSNLKYHHHVFDLRGYKSNFSWLIPLFTAWHGTLTYIPGVLSNHRT